MKNWKTTLGGILLAFGGPLSAATTGYVQITGMVLSFVGALLLGKSALDAKKTK